MERTSGDTTKSISLEVGLFHWIWAAVFLQSDIATSLGKTAQSDIKSTDPSLCFYWAYMFHLYVYFIHCIDFCNFNFHVFDIFPERTHLTIHIFPKVALVWDVARWKCIKVWGTPFVTLGLGLLYVYFYFPISKLHCFLQIKGHIKMFLLT